MMRWLRCWALIAVVAFTFIHDGFCQGVGLPPPPDESACAKARKLVQDVFSDDLSAARTPVQKGKLAERILKAAAETLDDPPGRYVMLQEAADLFAQAGDAPGAMSAIDQIEQLWKADGLHLRAAALKRTEGFLQNTDQRAAFIKATESVIDRCISEHQPDLLHELKALAVKQAIALHDPDLARKLTARGSGQSSAGATPAVVNLFRSFNVASDVVAGEWRFEQEDLITNASKNSRIEFAYRPPEEYDYRVSFTRQSGDRGFILICVAAGRQFCWRMGVIGNRCTFNELDGHADAGNPTLVHGPPLEIGQKHQCVVKIRHDSVAAYLDDQLMDTWKTDYRDMGLHPDFHLHRSDTLGLVAHLSAFAIHSAEVIEVSGSGRPLAAGDSIDSAVTAEIQCHAADGDRNIVLYANGHIDDPNGKDVWFLRGDKLTLQIGTAFTRCTLSADRTSFTSDAQKGQPISGTVIKGSLQ